MSIVESDGPPSWSLDVSETGESTKCPWVGVVKGTAGEKNRETVKPGSHLRHNDITERSRKPKNTSC